jgi:hypothetical protein
MCKDLLDYKSVLARRPNPEDPKEECSHEAVNITITSVYGKPCIMKSSV